MKLPDPLRVGGLWLGLFATSVALASSPSVADDPSGGATTAQEGGGFVVTDADWIALGGNSFSPRGINAVIRGGADVFVGGAFTSTPDGAANHVAKWNGSAWSALGGGVDDRVFALAWDGSNLYAGGLFANAGGAPAAGVAMWNGSAWSALGAGPGGTPYALAWGDGQLYAGTGSLVARWDGNAWTTIGTHNGTLSSLWYSDGVLYAGGLFTFIGEAMASNIARWDGNAWSPVGNGLGGISGVWAITSGGRDIYASVDDYVLKWDGQTWAGLGRPAGFTYSLAWDGRRLYAGGQFTSVSGTQAKYVAVLDRGTWRALGNGTNEWVTSLAWDEVDRRILVSGDFFAAGDKLTAVAAIKPPEIFFHGFE
jgi:hypothetical protein